MKAGIECKRTFWIDGLEFISMLIVFLCHFRMAFFPNLYGYINLRSIKIPSYLVRGNLAVCMFLIVSVYLMFEKSFNERFCPTDILLVILKRFMKFTISVFIVNLFIYLIYLIHGFTNLTVDSNLFPNAINWFNFNGKIKTFLQVLFSSIVCCFSSFCINPPLWCLYLFFLSMVVFFILLLCNSYCVTIPIVILIYLQKSMNISKNHSLFITIFLLLLVFMIQIYGFTTNCKEISKFNNSIDCLLAACVFNICYLCGESCFLNKKIFTIVNRISFGIYFLHMPIICTLGFFIYEKYGLWFCFFVIVIVLIIFSVVFYELIEKRLLNFIYKKIEFKVGKKKCLD